MKIIKVLPLILFFLLCCSMSPSLSCTSFHLSTGGHHFVGKNYDWIIGNGLVIVNKRGMQKEAFKGFDEIPGYPALWKSKYGSITFNQYGRELPMGGINEMGLVVEVMLLGQTKYPESDEGPSISPLQWVQFQLDTAATTFEVLSGIDNVRIYTDKRSPGFHFFICDPSGACAVIEFLGGKPVLYTGDQLPLHALANSTYQDSLRDYQKHVDSAEKVSGTNRFTTAGYYIERWDNNRKISPIDGAMAILDKVAQGTFTKWQIVYDLNKPAIYFRTSSSRGVGRIELEDFDFSCAAPVKVFDLHYPSITDVTKQFSNYTHQKNAAMIRNSFGKTIFLSDIAENEIDRLAAYPDGFSCTEKNVP